MKRIIKYIDQKKHELENNSLCHWLTTADRNTDALGFTPSMSYFVLGFRDILELAKRSNPQTELDFAINNHCEEDREHWKWFLQDIQNLGYLNLSAQEFVYRIWSDEERTPRNMIYFITHLIQTETDQKSILTVIECLEAAFAVFIEALKPQLIARGYYTKLIYFGQQHDLGEQSHALGSWIEGESVDDLLLKIELSSEDYLKNKNYVDQVFNKFQDLFNHWFNVAQASQQFNEKIHHSFQGELNKESLL